MAEELGKIEKPSVEEFREGRKLYFVPLVYAGKDSPLEYLMKHDKYWSQVEEHVAGLEVKIGEVAAIFYEMVVKGGEEGNKEIEEINPRGHDVVKRRLDKGAKLQPVEDGDLLAEIMDWSRCLTVGLQNQRVFTTIYNSYIEASRKRNEYIAKRIDETLEKDGVGILFMREGHQVQFPPDVQVFYVAPPALDELKRWLRDFESAKREKENTGEVESE